MPRFKFAPRSLVIRTNHLVPNKVKVAVCSEIHKEHINELSEQNVEIFSVKLVIRTVTARL